MSSEFEWRFGEDLPEDRGQDEGGSRPSWRRWWPLLLVLLLAAGGAYTWWRGRQHTLTEAEAEVEQVARLELQALLEGDADVFLSLQDPADRSWKEAQEAYLDTRGLPLPLQDLTSPISTTVEGAHIVGERAQVEIFFTATLASGEKGIFRAVRFYRYTSDGRWLHTRAEPGYADHQMALLAGDLQIAACGDDASWIDPGTRQLATVPSRFCELLPCDKYAVLKRQFGVDLEEARSMAATLGATTILRLNLTANLEEAADPDDAVLPAPFLIGAPRNGAARAAWLASLRCFVVDYLITREIRPRPADEHGGALFEERLRAWFKAELEVTEPVSPNLDLIREALDNEEWIPLWRLWEVEPGAAEGPLAAAEIDLLLAFIEEELGPSAVAELLHSLRETSSTEQFLRDVRWEELLHPVREASGTEQILNPVPWPARSSVALQFPAYVRERTASLRDDLSAFASYDLLIGCSEEAQAFRAAELWGCRLGSAEPVLLAARPPDEGLVPVSWSPDGARVLLRRQSTSYSSFFLLQGASGALTRLVVPNGATPGYLGPSGWSPDGSRLAYPIFRMQSPDSIDMQTRIVDLETGDETVLDGEFIAWSPDGSTLLYAGPSSSQSASEAWLSGVAIHDFYLARVDGKVLRRIGEGYAAAWSPDGKPIATIGTEQALVAHDLSASTSTTLLDRDTLREALGVASAVSAVSDRPFRLAWSPDSEWLAVGVTQLDDAASIESIILLARPGEHRLLRQTFSRIADLSWAPNGQWLRLFAYRGDQIWTSIIGTEGSLLLREENATVTWSSDGRYLALTRFGDWGAGLEIRDLTSGERRKIDVPGMCSPAIWNPRGSGQEPAPGP